MLLRPIKSLLFIGLAFVAGIFYERAMMEVRCDARGGKTGGGVCVDISQ
jgi:hypothetical protein